MPSHFIATATPELLHAAYAELRELHSDLQQIRSFRDGVFEVQSSLPTAEFTEAAVRRDPIFVRHLMPAQAEVALPGCRSCDLPALLAAAVDVCGLAAGERFCVQCRHIAPGHDYNAKDVEVYVGSWYEGAGAVPTFSDLSVRTEDRLKVLSIYVWGDTAYLGCATATENLNEHCDEYRVFARRPRDVSRAEFKLIEAIRKFRLHPTGGRALDLGAAPGGWSKVLADLGLQVVAIDPANLHDKVVALPSVTHLKMKAQEYRGDEDLDLLVNNMNDEPEESAHVMVDMAPHLKPGAPAIMTVKLMVNKPTRVIAAVRPILEQAYTVARLKDLFHNRQEVTILLRRNQ